MRFGCAKKSLCQREKVLSVSNPVVKESFLFIMLYTLPPMKTSCLADKVGVIPTTHIYGVLLPYLVQIFPIFSFQHCQSFKKINMALFSTLRPLSIQMQFHKPILLCYLHDKCSDKLQCHQHRPLQPKLVHSYSPHISLKLLPRNGYFAEQMPQTMCHYAFPGLDIGH